MVYLSVGDVIALHLHAMSRLGMASQGLRDQGALESALARARQAAYYLDADIVAQAALIGVGVLLSHSFVDGNKRTAHAALITFLRVNRRAYSGEPIDLARWLITIAERIDDRDAAISEFELWLRANVEHS